VGDTKESCSLPEGEQALRVFSDRNRILHARNSVDSRSTLPEELDRLGPRHRGLT